VDINARTQKQEEENKKLKKDALFNIVASLINRTHPPLAERIWPIPEFKIYVQRDQAGIRQYLCEQPNKEVHYVDFEWIVDRIMKYVRQRCGSRLLKGTTFLEKEARELAKFWRSQTDDFPHKIKPVAQLSDNSYTFKKLPFDFSLPSDFGTACPAFHEFFSRTSNAQALMAWIGSLFDPQADRQQYVWIYGQGRNGKGSVARVLATIFGHAATWEHAPTENERRFWASGLLGKRLVIFDDCSNFSFVSTGFFKSLTGGSSVRVEQKGLQPFSADLPAKFLFLSNDKPLLEGKTADLRRVIFCESQPITKDFGPHYERDWLAPEVPDMIGHCIAMYERLTAGKRSIPTDESQVIELVADTNERFDSILHDNFQIDPKLTLPSECVKAGEFSKIIERCGIKSNLDIKRFKDYIHREYGITRKSYNDPILGKRMIRYYEGLQVLSHPPDRSF